jgi:hypothetical protein
MEFQAGKAPTFLLATGIAGVVHAAAITENDSTQPRGSPRGLNDHRQSTDPSIDGFGAQARFSGIGDNQFQNSMGSIMPWSIRDPSVFAASSLAAGLALAAVIAPHFT